MILLKKRNYRLKLLSHIYFSLSGLQISKDSPLVTAFSPVASTHSERGEG